MTLDVPVDSNCCSEPEVFDDSDMVGADVVLLRGCPQSCMPNSVEGFHEVYEDVVEFLLVLEIFLTEDS